MIYFIGTTDFNFINVKIHYYSINGINFFNYSSKFNEIKLFLLIINLFIFYSNYFFINFLFHMIQESKYLFLIFSKIKYYYSILNSINFFTINFNHPYQYYLFFNNFRMISNYFKFNFYSWINYCLIFIDFLLSY